MTSSGKIIRMKIYVGEDKRHGDVALYEAIVRKARQLHCAGATVYRGIEGYGRSTRLHTVEVLSSEDLPVVIEIIDSQEKIMAFRQLLETIPEIGLVTCDTVESLWPPERTVSD